MGLNEGGGTFVSQDWHPIETAPKDGAALNKPGPQVLVWDGKAISIAAWEIINLDRVTGWWRCFERGEPADFSDYDGPDQGPVVEPTHWMPLPNPPTGGPHG